MPAKRVKRWCGRERNGRRKPESVPPGSTISPLAIWGGGKGGGKKQNEWKRGSAVISTKAAGQGKASCLAPLAGWVLLSMSGVCRIRRRCALFLNGGKPLDLVVDRSFYWAVVLFLCFLFLCAVMPIAAACPAIHTERGSERTFAGSFVRDHLHVFKVQDRTTV
ncbi:hypothetical protein B0J18DRAFT_255580 [Chaetomium sp. MPI-SDFR-AT-0129]|nr:hypothetical protein B0J18DRAFT_255580 [Chaetomium sp. MPI-SDFR-AT-0129]